jgi:glycosyltransferase involved in cell wall biosynthesis
VISVYIPNHNDGPTLARAIRSARQPGVCEIVVIDDASTDNSLDVAAREAADSPLVRIVANKTKADNWQQAVARVLPGLFGDYIIGMGADDFLQSGVGDKVIAYAGPGVIFRDYYVMDWGENFQWPVIMGYGGPTLLSPDEVCQRLAGPHNATETGIGSAVRADCQRWLCDLEFWTMGPWGDAIGYAAVAAKFGAGYVPGFGAAFTMFHSDGSDGYGQRSAKDQVVAAASSAGVHRFLDRAGLPADVAAALVRKRGVLPR